MINGITKNELTKPKTLGLITGPDKAIEVAPVTEISRNL